MTKTQIDNFMPAKPTVSPGGKPGIDRPIKFETVDNLAPREPTPPANLGESRLEATLTPSVGKDTEEQPASDGHQATQPQEATACCNPLHNPGEPRPVINISNPTNCPIIIGPIKDSTVKYVQDIREGKLVGTKDYPCSEHEGEVMRFYCTTCQRLICVNCTVVYHCKHECLETKEATILAKLSLKDTFPELKVKINEHQESLAEVAIAKEEFTINITRIRNDVRDAAKDVIAKVRVDEERLINEIEALEQDRRRIFDEHENKLCEMLQHEQYLMEIAQDVAERVSDSHLLSLYPVISGDLSSLINCPTIPKIEIGLSRLKLTLQHLDDITLGELDLVESRNTWELGVEFGKDTNTFGWAIDVQFLSAEEIAVADADKKQVTIHSITGNQKSIIRTTSSPWSVASMNNQILAVDMSERVKVYNKSGALAFEFPTVQGNCNATQVELRDLVVTTTVILVGDVTRKVLTEHEHDGSFKRIIPVETKPRFLAFDGHDRVLISGDDQRTVYVVDYVNGATLFTIKPTMGSQQVKYCQGVCCDGTNIYIAMCEADTSTGHIHRYNSDGTFLGCIIKGLYNPFGISFSPDGKIAVADWRSVKIYHRV